MGSCDALSPAPGGQGGGRCLCDLLLWCGQGPTASVLSLGVRAPKAAQGQAGSGPEQRRPQAKPSHQEVPAASELTQDCVFSISAVSHRCVSSICRALDWTWKVALAAELGAKNLVAEECLPCARGCNRAAATRSPGRAPRQRVRGQARSTEGLRSLLQGTRSRVFPNRDSNPGSLVSRPVSFSSPLCRPGK